MSEIQSDSYSEDKYTLLGLTVVSRHEAKGLNGVIREFQSTVKKVRIVQLVTAVLLLIFLSTDMLPYGPVLLSAAAVFISVLVVGKRILRESVDEARVILDGVTFDPQSSLAPDSLDSAVVKELVHTGTFITKDGDVINVDGEEIVICQKTS